MVKEDLTIFKFRNSLKGRAYLSYLTLFSTQCSYTRSLRQRVKYGFLCHLSHFVNRQALFGVFSTDEQILADGGHLKGWFARATEA